MLTLAIYPAAFGQFSASPFCVKSAYMLTLSGAGWRSRTETDPRRTPYGKLPVLHDGDQEIADSDNIRAFLEAGGADFDPGLTRPQKASSRALIRMAEEHLYFHIVTDRWANPRIWPRVRDAYFAGLPRPMRHIIAGSLRKSVLRGLHFQGVARFDDLDRLGRLESDLTALTHLLEDGPFLFGARVTSADLSMAPMLAAAAATPGKTALTTRIREDAVLTRYVAQVADICEPFQIAA